MFCSQIPAYKRLARKIFWNKELGHCCRRWKAPFGARADSISRAFARTIPVSRCPTLRVKVVRHSGRDKSCGKAGIRKAQLCDAFCKRGWGRRIPWCRHTAAHPSRKAREGWGTPCVSGAKRKSKAWATRRLGSFLCGFANPISDPVVLGQKSIHVSLIF